MKAARIVEVYNFQGSYFETREDLEAHLINAFGEEIDGIMIKSCPNLRFKKEIISFVEAMWQERQKIVELLDIEIEQDFTS